MNYGFPPHTLLQPSVPAAARRPTRRISLQPQLAEGASPLQRPAQEVTVLSRSGSGETSAVRRLSPVSKRGISFPPPLFSSAAEREEEKKNRTTRDFFFFSFFFF